MNAFIYLIKMIASQECGTAGTRQRMRVCDNPAPENGGNNCEGPATEQEDCNIIPCELINKTNNC